MSDTIQRYAYDPYGGTTLIPHREGAFVKHANHLAAMAKLERDCNGLSLDCAAKDAECLAHIAEIKVLEARAERAEQEAATLRAENDAITDRNQTQFLELEYLRNVRAAAERLYGESEEYDFDDGLGRGAAQQYWDALGTALDTMTDAQRAAIDAARAGGE